MYAKLQSGERFDSLSNEKVESILKNLHPEYNARATFFTTDDEWLSVIGCISDGFALSYQAAGSRTVYCCERMLTHVEVKAILACFIHGDSSWRTAVSWKRSSRFAAPALAIAVAVVIISILVLLLLDLAKWF